MGVDMSDVGADDEREDDELIGMHHREMAIKKRQEEERLKSYGGMAHGVKALLETTTEAFQEGSLAKRLSKGESRSVLGQYSDDL